MKIFRRNKWIGTYPSCDCLNHALNILLEHPDTNKEAIEEIVFAIYRADGYLYDYVREKLIAKGFETR